MQTTSFSSLLRNLFLRACIFGILGLMESPSYATWDWRQTPSDSQWAAFQKLNQAELSKLWKSLEAKRLDLEDLSWEWRLGWIRACAASQESWCAILLQYGLFDKALIVRAESAAILGKRFEGTGHGPALRLLETAYRIQQNQRHKEPLFIQYRILEAIHLIGGPQSGTLGMRLAQSSAKTARYWDIIRD